MEGIYFIKVQKRYGQGSYIINANFVPTEFPENNDSEPNDTFTDAIEIQINSSDTGHVGYHKNGDTDTEDWYKVDLPHDGALKVVVEPGTELDTYIWIYDVDGETNLSSADNGSYGEVDSLKISNLMEGIYFINVQKRYGQGSYILSVSTPGVLTANFSADKQTGSAPLTIQFSDLSSSADSWVWNFGDGNSSTEQNPSHTYSEPGKYPVKLKVSDGSKTDSIIKNDFITVSENISIDTNWNILSSNISNNLIFIKQFNGSEIITVTNEGEVYKSQNNGENWTSAGSLEDKEIVRNVYLSNSGKLWFLTENGGIYVSDDTGKTWETKTSAVSTPLLRISFYDDNTGWITGDHGVVLKTTNGGESWTKLTGPDNNHLSRYHFINESEGIVLSHYGKIFKTYDGGETWELKADYEFSSENRGWAALEAKSANEFYAVATNLHTVYLSTDTGKTWELKTTHDGNTGLSGAYYTDGKLIVLGTKGQFAFFDENSAKWNYADFDTSINISYLDFSEFGITLCGSNGFIARNFGTTENPQNTYAISIDTSVAQESLDTVRFSFKNKLIENFTTCLNVKIISDSTNKRFATYACLDSHMWIEGDSVIVVAFEHYPSLGMDTGTIGIVFDKILFANGDSLSGDTVYFRWSASGMPVVKKSVDVPKHFGVGGISFVQGKTAKIRIALPEASSITMSVYNLTGRIVKTENLQSLRAGYHTINYNCSNLANGNYILNIRAGKNIVNKRLNLYK